MQMLVRVAAVLVLLGGLVLGAAWMGFIDIPGITPVERRVGVPPTVQLEGPQPVTAVLSHALVIDSWRTYETPRDLVPALGSRLPEMLFYVSVVDAGERGRQFELLAGPATSALEADALRGPLAEVLDRYDPASWRVVDAPLAFFFGEYPDREAADARAAQLDGLGVPAYVLQVEYEGARTAYRVYGGAFSDEFQAAAMAALIGEAGLSDIPLIERRGHRPE
ncbi:MAG: hypothetical protein D6701_08265 [Gemmatimonadetes bacterium]|nr:MAG: hypothetical protein D6701_08265 [Gemmatimonadota bacterium]